jgi:hypothetical protein
MMSSKCFFQLKPFMDGQDRSQDLGGSSPMQKDGNREKIWREAPEHAIIPEQEANLHQM